MAPFRILVVDDFAPWRSYLRSILGECRQVNVVGEAADGLEAVQKVDELRPDLILMDIALPGLNGIEAAKRIRGNAPNSKILFLSVEASQDFVEAALAAGGCGYIVKTEVRSKLLPAIHRLLGK
jgi:DNA-binding NarL/FixJ family response regulator